MYWVGLILSSFNIPKYNTEKPSLGRKTEHPTVTATCHLQLPTAHANCYCKLLTANQFFRSAASFLNSSFSFDDRFFGRSMRVRT